MNTNLKINGKILWTIAAAVLLSPCAQSLAQQNPLGMVKPRTAKVKDRFVPSQPANVSMVGGFLGARVAANEKNRMLTVDENDMLDAFERRESPHQDWQGEHVGKYLHAATLAWANTGDQELKTKLDRVVARLLKTQEVDGYLGTYVPGHRWTSWDVWVHKYDLLGLLTYYQYTRELPDNDEGRKLGNQALVACRKIGLLLISTFGSNAGQRDINKSGEHVGMAPDSVLEPMVLLYRATNEPRFLEFANYIVSNYNAPGGPAILATLEDVGSVRKVANAKAYEMTSNFNGLLELYRATGDRRLLSLMRVAWEDIVKNRLYVTGSASAGEHFQNEFHMPNGNSANICETCVTVTWEQMNMQLLRLTGEARFAEEIERSVYNHLLAAQKPFGDDWVYYTPLEGHKVYDKVTTCCHSSGPRGIALLPEIAAMSSDDDGIVLNLYNTGSVRAALRSGKVVLEEKTNYPLDGAVMLTVNPEHDGARFPLRLRIPSWCGSASLLVNGAAVPQAPVPGEYAVIDRRWKHGDTVSLEKKISMRMVVGDHENEGRAAVMYGPLVLALDAALNPGLTNPARAELSGQTDASLGVTVITPINGGEDVQFHVDGHLAGSDTPARLTLTPFASAGQDGKSRFTVWIPLPGKGLAPTAGSLFEGARKIVSRVGNNTGDINDGDASTFSVTFDGTPAQEDWFGLVRDTPIEMNRVVFTHGKSFHDGGWFDTSAGKPSVQVQLEPGGAWTTVAQLVTYPGTTATGNGGLQDGYACEVKFGRIKAYGVRVTGKPACGDNLAQSFVSCAELQAFLDK